MTPGEVETEVRACYWDWRHLLANPRFCRNGKQISWTGYSGGVIRDPITYEKVRSLIQTKQFSFQCADDGSVFQLLYDFDDNEQLRLVRLAFYKAPLPLSEEDLESVGPLPDFSDLFVPWLRFDHAKEYATGVLHYESHMHISGFPETRLVVSGVPGPRQFVEFVVAACFPDYYKDHRLNDAGMYRDHDAMQKVNTCYVTEEGRGADSLIHVSIPGHHLKVPVTPPKSDDQEVHVAKSGRISSSTRRAGRKRKWNGGKSKSTIARKGL